jgi:hypothetical protein
VKQQHKTASISMNKLLIGALFIAKLTIKFITIYDALREIAESWTDTGYRLGGMVEWR